MDRFEITNSAAEGVELHKVKSALKAVGASRVRSRHAFGWRNQPRVITFAAPNQETAKKLCEMASVRVGATLIPYRYTGGKWIHNPRTNTSEFKES